MQNPPELVTIKTKGRPGGYLTAIQLVYSNDITSPWFDTNYHDANVDGIREVQIAGKSIKKIHCHGDDTYTCSLIFEHENGKQEIYNKKMRTKRDMTVEIQDKHRIIGVYGRVTGAILYYLGFITAEITE